MKAKTPIRRALRILSLILALLLFVSFAQTYLLRNNERDALRMDGFRMEEKNSLDVVILGSSEVYADFASAYAYELEGFTSYPYAVASCPVTLWKTMTEDILATQSPQLIVVEINGALYMKLRWLYNNAAFHYVLDGMPLGENKTEALNTLLRDRNDEKETYILPILKYHSTWQDPADLAANLENVSGMRQRGHTLLRGVSTSTAIHEPEAALRKLKGNDRTSPLHAEAETYLREYLEYCREKGLNVLFTCFPHQIEKIKGNVLYANFMRTNTAEQIIAEYGFPFLNLEKLSKEIGLDYTTDFYNTSHLNIYGQKKVTEYLSRYLVEQCGVVPGDHGEAQKAAWEESAAWYDLYSEYAESLLQAGTARTLSETERTLRVLESRKSS